VYIYFFFCHVIVKSKFGLATKADLQVLDTDTNVEEDILHELIEVSPYLCQTVRCSEENITAGLSDGKSIITLETYF